MERANLNKVDISLNGDTVNVLSFIAHADVAQAQGRSVCKKLEVSERREASEPRYKDENTRHLNATSTTKLTQQNSFGSLGSFRSSFIKNAHNLASLGTDYHPKSPIPHCCASKGEREGNCQDDSEAVQKGERAKRASFEALNLSPAECGVRSG